jgi:hypothetical protein
MHLAVRIGIAVTIVVALISASLFLWYSIQVDSGDRWIYPMAVTLGITGLSLGAATWAQLRRFRKEFKEFRDEVQSRLVIRQAFDEDELMRSVFPGDDR